MDSYFDLFWDDNVWLPQTESVLPQTVGVLPMIEYAGNQSSDKGIADYLLEYLDKASSFASKYEPLIKLTTGGLGALAGYLSAKEYNKRADEARKALDERAAAKLEEKRRLEAPRQFTLSRRLLELPDTRVPSMAKYFSDNGLASNPSVVLMAGGGPVLGQHAGQEDVVPALLSPGEFVVDAETVSMLGDGNTSAGVSALEQMRREVRKHKRHVNQNNVAPKAKSPSKYIKKE